MRKRLLVLAAIITALWQSPATSLADNDTGFVDPTTGMAFVKVPGGCFQMGDTFGGGSSDEKPVHEVCVDSFYMAQQEVTQGEYSKVVGQNPASFRWGERYPVEQVSWSDAQAFINKLNELSSRNYRLPTEAEWEYAARNGGKEEKFPGGDEIAEYAWYSENSNRSTQPVGSKQPNSLGLHDLLGNVWEWCHDWYGSGYYRESPRDNPAGPPSGTYRVTRGGGWNDTARSLRVTDRNSKTPGYRNARFGFRLVHPVP
jgi:formylglycine-generating enzyme